MEKFETKHTPGPWSFGSDDNASFEVMIGDTTCTLDRAQRNTDQYIISREEMIANGHLVAAAPLLLSALIKAVKQEDKSHSLQTFHQYPEWYDDAKAAIRVAISQPENVKQ